MTMRFILNEVKFEKLARALEAAPSEALTL
jgi:hypothetical protein